MSSTPSEVAPRVAPRRTPSRTRWAAIGAAIAITLGAGGLITVNAAEDSSSFVPTNPRRVLDTRPSGTSADTIVSATPRLFKITGFVNEDVGGGILPSEVVPEGATAVVANVTVVDPTTAGYVSIRPGDVGGTPITSNINFTSGGVVVANSVTVRLPTDGGLAGFIEIWFQGADPSATTNVIIDVLGYYMP